MTVRPLAPALLFVAFSVHAQSPEYNRCMTAAAGHSNQVFACNQQEMRRQDKRVDAAFREMQVKSQSDAQKQADVRTEQRNWLQHRDFACSKPDESENMRCMIRETAAEADKLQARLH